ncbi:MAG: PLP-dependent transferase, partial [Bdellovibrionales bacterium]|nr:PLP-dependent transferase [Bdellovibrionales bacterium]
KYVRKYLQHSGQIISFRHAEAIIKDDSNALLFTYSKATPVYGQLQQRIASFYQGVESDQVYLHPTGMGSMHFAHQLTQAMNPGKATALFGFPYTDTKMLLQELGEGFEFFPIPNGEAMRQLELLLKAKSIGAIVTEFPSNPLLTSVDLEDLSQMARKHNVPLVVDDTLSTPFNCKLTDAVDVIVTSLSKFTIGSADTLGGSLILPPESPHASKLGELALRYYQDICFPADLSRILERSVGYEKRVRVCGDNANELANFLSGHPAVDTINYPSLSPTREFYDEYRVAGGNYGGLLSFTVKGGKHPATTVFDNLQVTKAPGLGTDFTMACMYTRLAHFEEFEQVKQYGIDPYLIRVSVGMEDLDHLRTVFETALESAKP